MQKKIGNPGAERAVLSGLCQFGRPALYDVSDIISVNSFSLEGNQALYKCIERVLQDSENVDATSVIAAADSLGLGSLLTKNKTDIEFIRSLFNFPIQLTNVRILAKQVAKLEFVRKSQTVLLDAYHKLENFDGSESVDEIVAVSENAAFALSAEMNNRTNSTPVNLLDNAEERLRYLGENPVEMAGIPTPWPIYNDIIGGGLRAGVHLVCSRQKVGKSTFAINVGWHVAKNLKIPVLYIDTEMSLEEQQNRLIANVTGVSAKQIETGQFAKNIEIAKKVYAAINEYKQYPFHHKWVGGKTFEEIISIIRRWIMSEVGFDENGNTKPHLVIYDYFKLMNDSVLNKMQEHQALGFQISYLTDFCKEYDTPCLSFAQLNRDGITKDTGDTIGDSDRLLRLCISCCLFKRKDKEEILEDGKRWGNRKLILLEGRFGEPLEYGDYVCMNLDGATSKITELKTKFQISAFAQSENSGFETEKENVTVDMNDLQ